MKSNRIKELDILRLMAIILVIIGHSTAYQYVSTYENLNIDSLMFEQGIADAFIHRIACKIAESIYLFHMPLFFAISGASFAISLGKKDENGRSLRYPTFVSLVVDKAKRLLIPYVVVNILWNGPLKYFAHMYDGLSKKQILEHIVKGQFFLRGNNYLWFLVALFQIFLVVYLLEKYVHIVALKVYVLVLLSMFKIGIYSPMTYTAMDNAIFFYVGFLWYQNREKYNEKVRQHKEIILVSFLLLMIVEYGKNIAHFDSMMMFNRFLGISSGCVFCYAVAVWLADNTDVTDSVILKKLNQYSLGLYLYTEPMNAAILSIVVNIFSAYVLGNELCALGVLVLRTVGVTLFSMIIVRMLKALHLKYLY